MPSEASPPAKWNPKPPKRGGNALLGTHKPLGILKKQPTHAEPKAKNKKTCKNDVRAQKPKSTLNPPQNPPNPFCGHILRSICTHCFPGASSAKKPSSPDFPPSVIIESLLHESGSLDVTGQSFDKSFTPTDTTFWRQGGLAADRVSRFGISGFG